MLHLDIPKSKMIYAMDCILQLMSHGVGRKAIIAAFLANIVIMIAKLIGFLFTGAASMLAEGIHSFADSSNQGLLLLGGRLAKRKEYNLLPGSRLRNVRGH
jgi:Co/Zn/Cd efflux system component